MGRPRRRLPSRARAFRSGTSEFYEDRALHRRAHGAVAYFNAFDAFYLPSREDPFPVACLEAAALGKDDAGIVVPYLDCLSAARAILRYREQPNLRERHGRRAQEKVKDYDIRVIGLQVVRVLDAVMAARPP
ncbi:MAG TPA: hypothetical protein VGL09_17045 [Methylomirabilota bacterium]